MQHWTPCDISVAPYPEAMAYDYEFDPSPERGPSSFGMEIDLHGYHPAEIVFNGTLGKIVQQAWEMGEKRTRTDSWPWSQSRNYCRFSEDKTPVTLASVFGRRCGMTGLFADGLSTRRLIARVWVVPRSRTDFKVFHGHLTSLLARTRCRCPESSLWRGRRITEIPKFTGVFHPRIDYGIAKQGCGV
jgi:hypothetical protein